MGVPIGILKGKVIPNAIGMYIPTSAMGFESFIVARTVI